ncbi:MAG: excinuclease ABC subunit UvrA [Bradymonadaceae bacterium]
MSTARILEHTRRSDLPEPPRSSASDELVIEGAREHNLRDVDLRLPKHQLVVFTGVSGSGKSSLAFDTIYAEGRRRYVESLSTYARRFLGQMDRPDVDRLDGLSPTVSIEQKTASHSTRSTVGTITEIYDYLRVLYAQLGTQYCHECGREVSSRSTDSVVDEVVGLEEGTKFMVLAPLVRNRKGEYEDLLEDLRQSGFARARIDGEFRLLSEVDKLDLHVRHDIDVVVDRLVARPDKQERIRESVELALETGDGQCLVAVGEDGDQERLFSTERTCPECGIAFPELSHQSFSFNSPVGQCPTCDGLGETPQVDPDLFVVHPDQTPREGCIEPIGPDPQAPEGGSFDYRDALDGIWNDLRDCAEREAIDLDAPWSDLTDGEREALLHGDGEFEGLTAAVREARDRAPTTSVRSFFDEFIVQSTCPDCEGDRLRRESSAVEFRGWTLPALCRAEIGEAAEVIRVIELEGREATIGADLLSEIQTRLELLEDVGVEYLSLHRGAATLSGGESQRVRLASQLGGELDGVLYVLDEPSIGLHQRDNRRLLGTLEQLREEGNSVIVVEHDTGTMRRADHLVDFGPGAGTAGGSIVAQGTAQDLEDAPESTTGDFLSGRRSIEIPEERRAGTGESIRILGARANNLKSIDVEFPLGTFICVTGVSGAGKSSLVEDILHPAAARRVYFKHRSVGDHDDIEGLEAVDKVIEIDQKPIGRTPRSTAATYTKVFDHVRKLYANLPTSEIYGFDKGRFSFNTDGGRCDECGGQGVQKVEMDFLSDVYVECEACLGRRYDSTTLRVEYRGHSIADVLDLTVAEAAELFEDHPKISRILETLLDVGLGYVRLGQPSHTLSGGEAQRVKLAREISKIATGDTLYILDEPTIGLHPADVENLLGVIHELVEGGNTVVVIEHDLDVIKSADHVVDLGPDGGDGGGRVVAAGPPEAIAEAEGSHTGRYLREALPKAEG